MASEFPPAAIKPIVEEVAALLKERNETISVAETAAGGIISASILSTPGASKIYKGGLTLYTLESRKAYGGWTEAHVANYNGPSPKIVEGLADEVRKTLGSTYTVSESGTAGPTGSGKTKNRQPGYVAVAVSTASGTYSRDLDTGVGTDREKNMIAFAVEALKLVKEVINGEAKL